MTPNARIAAAITVLDTILAGQPAEQALLRWSRGARYAGSGDRAAVRDLVFDSLRRRRSRAALGGAETGRGLMLGMLRETGTDPATVFTGQGHNPQPVTPQEGGTPPQGAEASDLPDWILPQWAGSLGDDAQAIALALRDRAPVWLRVNSLKATPAQALAQLARDGISAEASGDLPTALRVTTGERRISASAAYQQGLVELQDLSPQLACAAVPLCDGDRVLDYCAGGGGKALALAARADVRVTAHDAEPSRMRDLPVRAARAGASIAVTTRPTGLFDLVVADVPCSGSGTWRRTPDQKWRLTAQDLTQLTRLQAQIMAEAAQHVRPGGHLAYMTCSLLQAENQAQVSAFLARNADFSQVGSCDYTPLTASDGFFLAILSRTAP
ncbi:MAG: RsmB/NOP family class I SAM-dependent RNA methyltransferase [Paracoccus sp. (in: a-proteobacteria)]|uniref:RsmB/NOP family class I SAM-dependent RNA methyltransferase n=1 Tax=Paracoccus sp. TaxID=267 RepID=UPI0026E01F9B|nr:RsmB/NOP family class I SAM-dependent RNA methyltransferase [Paracoccus sp. (in: a-proteobacteria)]MDO5613373.1 RsmB/NOP family class I SAM-dependent RNA methyltransferase [Paracoccus sp. (in: a-proteobacteria)]